jgi:hypothetical protein
MTHEFHIMRLYPSYEVDLNIYFVVQNRLSTCQVQHCIKYLCRDGGWETPNCPNHSDHYFFHYMSPVLLRLYKSLNLS